MASGHQQAYLSESEVIAASPAFDPAILDLPNPGGDALVGLGRVAALFTGDFTHVVAGAGIEHWNAPFWREDGEYLEEIDGLETGPLDLARAVELLADAPQGVREALIDAALEGPVTLVEDDPERRAAWIVLITAIVPEATFTTFAAHPIDVRICITTSRHANAFPEPLDTALPIATQASRFATVAAAVAARAPALLGSESDPIVLAVKGGATDVLTPEDLPRALELILDLARRGEIATAARAAAGLGASGTALVLAEAPALALELHAPVEAEPVDAEVVEEGISLRELEAELEPPRAAADLFGGGISLQAFAAALEQQVPAVVEAHVPEPETPAVREDTFGGGMSLHELEAPPPEPVPFVPAPVGRPEPVREDTFGSGMPRHDLEDAVEPHPAESGRSLEELMAAFTEDPLEAPEADEEPIDEVTEETELGISLSELEATLEVDEEVGMSLEDFEASLKRERES